MVSMNSLPAEIIENILRKIPSRQLVTVSHVSQLFSQLALPLITESDSCLWHKNAKEHPDVSRSLLLKFTSLRVLNMDYCRAMFDNMTSEQADSFATQLAEKCQQISTIYMSDITCFRIIHTYLVTLHQLGLRSKLRNLIIFIDSDESKEEKESILQQILHLSPNIEKLDVTRIDSPQQPLTCSSHRSSRASDGSIKCDLLSGSSQSDLSIDDIDTRDEIENEAMMHSLVAEDWALSDEC